MQGVSVQGEYVLGGKFPGSKCPGGTYPGGKCPGGICPWGKCLGITCPGGYVLEPFPFRSISLRYVPHSGRSLKDSINHMKYLRLFHCVLRQYSPSKQYPVLPTCRTRAQRT